MLNLINAARNIRRLTDEVNNEELQIAASDHLLALLTAKRTGQVNYEELKNLTRRVRRLADIKTNGGIIEEGTGHKISDAASDHLLDLINAERTS